MSGTQDQNPPPKRESLKCSGTCSEGRSSDVTAHQVGLKSAFPPGPLGPERVLFLSAVTASAGPSPPVPPLPPPHAQVWTVPGHLVWAGGQRGANPAGSPAASAEWPGRAALVCPSLLGRAPCLEPPAPQPRGATGGMAAPPAPRWRQRVLSCPPCAQGPPSEQGGVGGGRGELKGLSSKLSTFRRTFAMLSPRTGPKRAKSEGDAGHARVRGAGRGSGLRSRCPLLALVGSGLASVSASVWAAPAPEPAGA